MEPTTTLADVLLESQRLGFLGPRPIDEVIGHARLFVDALAEVSGTVLDLGAGGGVPGLVVAADRPDLHVTLLDRRAKRADFLERVVRRLGWSTRVRVVNAEARQLVGDPARAFDAVIARGFGPPELTLRTAAGCARPGAVIVISEPPTGDRWPPSLLAAVGVTRLTSHPLVARFRAST